jgi:hypothetical protein
MATKEQNAPSEEMDPCQVRSTALGAFERTHGRTQAPSARISGVALAGPRVPSLPACTVGSYLRSNVECTFECIFISVF